MHVKNIFIKSVIFIFIVFISVLVEKKIKSEVSLSNISSTFLSFKGLFYR